MTFKTKKQNINNIYICADWNNAIMCVEINVTIKTDVSG